MRKKGLVIKFMSNMALVEDFETKKVYMCKLRGKFKEQGIRPIVGDCVEFRPIVGKEGVIENILNRKNELKRPKIANIDQVVVVTSLKKPNVPLKILDRYLVLVENAKLPAVIVLNKCDLLSRKEIDNFLDIYSKLYSVYVVSAKNKIGIDKLIDVFKNKVSTMAGMSGVGKSSILNAINPGLSLRVGEISEKLDRGKHTTTVIEFLKFDFGGWVADTPGFANLDISDIERERLKEYFPEFGSYFCLYPDCNHINEPECGVKNAVEKGLIAKTRYESYFDMFQELSEGN
ncbi:ribosome biogenesis GTPase RsgA [Thermosipho melanesiensis]|uniref:Small ribosomal subunit biogenesis GTPase RsgA n=2 Tax=Thermosipho melanesiensis TaxID=46541 RepID=A6LN49_THEM4|nr:ribosome small subunit-dependent GTPase A [Thermosipho melanesiensis]ABR31350.1 ribosome small subunit-dependent GTPase A [Thermosipho melanesiensis BI429]APT74410.1 ribosome biogenesis GTPase RsgA [Thermosipho melanesiensis]OOC36373.1 ribosome biogenesis GTPase RsgA [Thermosipho melanesiensis]OOC37191.1 ribosome biogenesis GTPase RsgA [Thermosipho melanesiensis]OOC37943.1 ribosome biogenesis GTPase RsgA [Thermosipho melanesiensis]